FTTHDLVTDQVFGEMQLVICRNVLIYFRRELQSRVLTLFYESLDMGGFLGLGIKESLSALPNQNSFRIVDSAVRLFQRID
ncbi:MAG TPA: CheR family methyltransferase, partial [Candidatus Kapabacteria bacterium]|nr:CheR family methyltransferase [Candidatus Kapabacteria bacterium]